ncbi:MAG: PAS domain S-box protein [Firmicutes bacterium]|nr:PAS domain S-box protein [Bacillota bacterium]
MAEEHFKNIIDFLPDPTFAIDRNGKVIAWNRAMEEMTGLSKGDILGRGDYNYAVPFYQAPIPILIDLVFGDIPGVKDKYSVFKRNGQIVQGECYLASVYGGRGAWVLAQACPLLDDAGNPVGAIQSIRDISELKQQKALFKQLFDNSPEGIVLLSSSDVIIDANRGFEELFGYRIEEIKGQYLNEIIVPDEKSGEATVLSGTALRGSKVYEETVRRRKDGSPVYVTVLAYPVEIGDKVVGIYGIYRDITRRKKAELLLRENQRALSNLMSNLQGMAYRCHNDPDWTMQFVSDGCLELTGYTPGELMSNRISMGRLTHTEDRERVWQEVQASLSKAAPFHIEYRIVHQSGMVKWVREQGRGVFAATGKLEALEGFISDITESVKVKEALWESESMYRTIFETTSTATVIVDEDTTISLANQFFENISGYSKEEIEGVKSWTEFVTADDLQKMKEFHCLRRVDPTLAPSEYECRFRDKYGKTRYVLLSVSIIPGTNKSVASLLDITERKKAEEQLKYLSLRDPLTGLFNRAFFEQEMSRLECGRYNPVGIIVCDVDGLKLVNDTLGHDAGDAQLMLASSVISKCFRTGDVVARVGGDEFAVLLSRSDHSVVERACVRIREALVTYNNENPELTLSISAGYAVSDEVPVNMSNLFREADNNMYREKLHRSQSVRSAIVQTMMKALEARDFITEGHADRLQDLVVGLAGVLRLPGSNITELRLLAQFHDIGKVGIPDRILFKPGPLNTEEKKEMQRHCEIGHRIALSAPDLAPIADWILKHHEWWNGGGYPLGLKEEQIPLECRILSIADAYDAMTSDRPYRRAMSRREAVAELLANRGTQFDPRLVDSFIRVLKKGEM